VVGIGPLLHPPVTQTPRSCHIHVMMSRADWAHRSIAHSLGRSVIIGQFICSISQLIRFKKIFKRVYSIGRIGSSRKINSLLGIRIGSVEKFLGFLTGG